MILLLQKSPIALAFAECRHELKRLNQHCCGLLVAMLLSQYLLDVCLPGFCYFQFAEVFKYLDFFIVHLFCLKFH